MVEDRVEANLPVLRDRGHRCRPSPRRRRRCCRRLGAKTVAAIMSAAMTTTEIDDHDRLQPRLEDRKWTRKTSRPKGGERPRLMVPLEDRSMTKKDVTGGKVTIENALVYVTCRCGILRG